ncbi:hypothetical protein PAECIP111892_03114 [Paenibacillus auburnensis]|uniref:Acyltransferase 3 domain-containing protein n=1 Tax=Paenibacillus auburnensis TaxID=2905649 RepID=A0ABM9CAF1_9BACL|nr:acyltransferase family protein [Paenibacillus auburnensis]CAH1208459.1 hypothetical protein PAECIP111892_03114 [Paenibacillus auburnensis]
MLAREEVNKGRQLEFDVAKALAIFFMVIIHVGDNMSQLDHNGMPYYYWFLDFIGGPMAAPMFMFAMGVGMVYTRYNSSGDFAKRGVKLIVLGYGLNFFRETFLMIGSNVLSIETDYKKALIDTIGTVDILHFAGMAFLSVALMRKLVIKKWMMLCIAIILQGIGTLFIGLFDSAPKVVQYVLGLLFFTNKYIAFPTTLWLVYPVLGICFASILRRVTDKQAFYKMVLLISSIGLSAISIGTTTVGYSVGRYFTGEGASYYQQNLFSTLWISCILGVSISVYYYISTPVRRKMENIIKYLSSNLNTIYVIQWLLITYTIATKEVIGLGSLPAPMIIPGGILIGLCSIGIAWLWNHSKARIVSSGQK